MNNKLGVLVSKKIKSPVMLWSDEETNWLEMFIIDNWDEIIDNITKNMKSNKTIKKDLFFKWMANQIKTRSAVQCKNKFYKLEKIIYTDILNIKED